MAIVDAIGAGIGGIGNIVGGILSNQSANAANRQQEAQFDYNARMAEDHFHNAVLYRVQDAKRAGIHPLAALGAQLQTPGAIPVGSPVVSDLGSALGRAGQDIGRAVGSLKREDEKVAAYNDAIRAATLSKTQAEIDYIRSMTERNVLNTGVPPVPGVARVDKALPGQGNSPYEPKTVPGTGHLRMQDGTLMPVKSKDATDRMDEDWFGNLKHFLIRTFGPMVDPKGTPVPPGKLPPGYRWWVDWKGDWKPVLISPNDVYRRGRHPSQRN